MNRIWLNFDSMAVFFQHFFVITMLLHDNYHIVPYSRPRLQISLRRKTMLLELKTIFKHYVLSADDANLVGFHWKKIVLLIFSFFRLGICIYIYLFLQNTLLSQSVNKYHFVKMFFAMFNYSTLMFCKC